MVSEYSKQVVKKSSRSMPSDIVAVSLMERFGWTWDEFQNTPERIVRLILEKDSIDSKLSKR